MNCRVAPLVRLSYPIRLVWEFGSSNPEGFFVFCFPFSKFLSLVSFFRDRLRVSISISISIRVRVRF